MTPRDAMMRIVIVNAHWNNRGDEAALLALLDGMRKEIYRLPYHNNIYIRDKGNGFTNSKCL